MFLTKTGQAGRPDCVQMRLCSSRVKAAEALFVLKHTFVSGFSTLALAKMPCVADADMFTETGAVADVSTRIYTLSLYSIT